MQLDLDQLKVIYADCDSSLELTAETLGMTYSEFALKWGFLLAPPPKTLAANRRTPPSDLGQDWCRKHTVSIRHAQNPEWPKADLSKIEAARALYERGTHEVVTGRDRDWFTLYCIPRQTRTGARKFFQVYG